MALEPRPRNPRSTTLPEFDAAAGRNVDILVQEGTRFLTDLERATTELDTLDTQFTTVMGDLRNQAGSEFEEARDAIQTMQRASSVPPGIARLLSFLGQDEFNTDIQRLRIEESNLGLAKIDQDMQTAVQLRTDRREAVERDLRFSSERFGLTQEILGAQRAEEAALRQEAYLAIARRQDQRAEINDIVTRVIPGLSDEELQEAINQGPDGSFGQFQGFLIAEQRGRRAAEISLASADAGLASARLNLEQQLRESGVAQERIDLEMRSNRAIVSAQEDELVQEHRNRFLASGNIHTFQELIDRAEGGVVTTGNGLTFTVRELQNAVAVAQEEQSAILNRNIDTAQRNIERALGFGETLDQVVGLTTISGPQLPQNIQRAFDEYNRLVDDEGNIKDEVAIEEYFATVQILQDRVDAEIDAYVENYSDQEEPRKAVRNYLERGGNFQTVRQSNSVLSENTGVPDRLAGTSLDNAYRLFTENYAQLEASNFEQTFEISGEEGAISLPVNRKIDSPDLTSRALREQSSEGFTPYQIAVDNIAYEYGVRVMQQLAEQNADMWAKFVRGDNFVTANGNPSFGALWEELARVDLMRRDQAATMGAAAPPSLVTMYQTALQDNAGLAQFMANFYNSSDMESRAFLNSLGLVNQSGLTNQSINVIGMRTQQIVQQGQLTTTVSSADVEDFEGRVVGELFLFMQGRGPRPVGLRENEPVPELGTPEFDRLVRDISRRRIANQ